MTRGTSWDRELRARRANVESFFADISDEPANDLESALDHALVEAKQTLDAGAGVSPWLDVRVSGPQVGIGSLSVRILDSLLSPIQAEIDAALPDARRDATRLELVGVGSGSAILHLQPSVPTAPQDETLDVVASTVDSAVRRVLDVHDATEGQLPAQQLAQLASHDLFTKLHRLVDVLEKEDLSLELVWRSPVGRRRRSTLTERGRSYAFSLFEQAVIEERKVVSGYVYEQSLKGLLKLKMDPKKSKSSTYDILADPDILRDQEFKLGRFVRALVYERRRQDKLGQRTDPAYELIEFLGHDEELRYS